MERYIIGYEIMVMRLFAFLTLRFFQGATNNTQMMPMGEQTIKNEQMRMYDNGRMFAADMSANMLGAPEVLQYAGFEPPQTDHHMSDAYGGKNSRLQYVNTPKLITQPETNVFNKYSAGNCISLARISQFLVHYRNYRLL